MKNKTKKKNIFFTLSNFEYICDINIRLTFDCNIISKLIHFFNKYNNRSTIHQHITSIYSSLLFLLFVYVIFKKKANQLFTRLHSKVWVGQLRKTAIVTVSNEQYIIGPEKTAVKSVL